MPVMNFFFLFSFLNQDIEEFKQNGKWKEQAHIGILQSEKEATLYDFGGQTVHSTVLVSHQSLQT